MKIYKKVNKTYRKYIRIVQKVHRKYIEVYGKYVENT